MKPEHTYLFQRLCIIGMGLIGGSLARALIYNCVCKEIVGYDIDQSKLDKALQLGVIHQAASNIESAVSKADIIVIAAPVSAMSSIFIQLKDIVPSSTVITDVGSTKRSVVDAAQGVYDILPSNFIPGHPLAGSENTGVEYSNAKLFTNCNVILTPLPTSSIDSVNIINKMWQGAGANVFELDIEKHDEILGATSHMPHILAYLLVDILASKSIKGDIFKYTAGGFRDFTRIASSDPALWCDISLANCDVISSMLDNYCKALSHLSTAISKGDRATIEATFTRAKFARDEQIITQ